MAKNLPNSFVYIFCFASIFQLFGCTSIMEIDTKDSPQVKREAGLTDLEVQALVMQMADDYIAALGEANYVIAASKNMDPKSRLLMTSFTRNGVGSAIDIASGPNPDVALLDMLTLCALQNRALEKHWVPAGVNAEVAAAVAERLRVEEGKIWEKSQRVLNNEQRQKLRETIDAWGKANPDRMVVAFVRFDDFLDARFLPASADRQRAGGLLKQVSEASAAVEDARLLGERLIWFAGRYPFVLGQQTELTSYRIAVQPEVSQLLDSLTMVDKLGKDLITRWDALPDEIAKQREALFKEITAQRQQVIKDLEGSARKLVDESIDKATTETRALLKDLAEQENKLSPLLKEVNQTVASAKDLAVELKQTSQMVDKILSRFEGQDAEGKRITLQGLQQTVTQATTMAVELRATLEKLDETVEASVWDEKIARLEAVSESLVNRIFWRGLLLILIFLAGFALVRWLVPLRMPKVAAT